MVLVSEAMKPELTEPVVVVVVELDDVVSAASTVPAPLELEVAASDVAMKAAATAAKAYANFICLLGGESICQSGDEANWGMRPQADCCRSNAVLHPPPPSPRQRQDASHQLGNDAGSSHSKRKWIETVDFSLMAVSAMDVHKPDCGFA